MPQGGDEGLARKYYENLKEHERFKATAKQQVAAKFTIRHYAGNVEYSTNKFCDKNKVPSLPCLNYQCVGGFTRMLLPGPNQSRGFRHGFCLRKTVGEGVL